MNFINNLLNRVTMYALMIYYLIAILALAFILALLGYIPYEPWWMLAGIGVFYLTTKLTNPLFGKIFRIKTNPESAVITGLILSLIVGPAFSWEDLPKFAAVGAIAMLSKYLIVWQKRHLFNPAAIAVVIGGVVLGTGASWWIGLPSLLPVVIIGGLLLLKKMRWWHLSISFLIIYLGFLAVLYATDGLNVGSFIISILTYSPILFFSFVMLTEPLTMPSGKKQRIIYGAIIGLLVVALPRFTELSYTLESSLLVGNIIGLLIFGNPRRFLSLVQKLNVAKNTTWFEFTPNTGLKYQAGQFLLWSLPHDKADSRGQRRYFTIASSPTEKNLALVTKFADKSSSFKTNLKSLSEHGQIMATSLDGDFTMPKDESLPLVFIAGGVGIAPFRSMTKFLIDNKQSRKITLLYSNNTEDEIAFADIWTEAKNAFGMKTVFTLTNKETLPLNWSGKTGFIDEELIKSEVLDFKKAVYFVSGPDPMVRAMEKTLHSLGIARKNIKTDYFPGYV